MEPWMAYSWGSPIGLGVFLAGLGVLMWGLGVSGREKGR
jgi:hypothetical protein